jgi:uncharacterized OB-fold protein
VTDYRSYSGGPLVDEHAEPPRFVGSACRLCGAIAFPPRRRCASCARADLEPAPIAPYGRLYSYTVVRIGRPHEMTPYAIGVADFPGGIRVLARLSGWAADGAGSPIGRTVTAGVADPPARTGDPRADFRLRVTERDGSDSSEAVRA